MSKIRHYELLNIPEDDCPPNHYELLDITLFEEDTGLIFRSALARIEMVRQFQTGSRANDCQKLLQELAQAQTILRNPSRKSIYDAELRVQLGLPSDKTVDKSVGHKSARTTANRLSKNLRLDKGQTKLKSFLGRTSKQAPEKILGLVTETQIMIGSLTIAGLMFTFIAIAMINRGQHQENTTNPKVSSRITEDRKSDEIAYRVSAPREITPQIPPKQEIDIPSQLEEDLPNKSKPADTTAVSEIPKPLDLIEPQRLSETRSTEAPLENPSPDPDPDSVVIQETLSAGNLPVQVPSVTPEGWIPFESFPSGVELPPTPPTNEQEQSLEGIAFLAGQPVTITYTNLDPDVSAVLNNVQNGQWEVINGRGEDAPLASLRRDGEVFFWKWSSGVSKATADRIRNGFLIFRSNETEKKLALRKPKTTDAFRWTFENGDMEKNKSAIEQRDHIISGNLNEDQFYLEITFADGRKEIIPAGRKISKTLSQKKSPCKLIAKWELKVRYINQSGEVDPANDTKITVEQYLQISIAGSKIPATMHKIQAHDQLLQARVREYESNREKSRLAVNDNQVKINNIIASPLIPPQKKTALLTEYRNHLEDAKDGFDKYDRLTGKWQNIIAKANVFGRNVLKPNKGKQIHYRVYLQHEINGPQIDILRSNNEQFAHTVPERTFFKHLLAKTNDGFFMFINNVYKL